MHFGMRIGMRFVGGVNKERLKGKNYERKSRRKDSKPNVQLLPSGNDARARHLRVHAAKSWKQISSACEGIHQIP